MMNHQLEVWTVYDRPSDYPTLFVVRKWLVVGGPDPVATSEVFTGPTLEDVRDQIPAGLHRMPRLPGDDAKIVESWL